MAAQRWTERVVTREQPPRVVDGLITGWHDPQASHLLLVEAIAGAEWRRRPTTPRWTAGTGGTDSATPRSSSRARGGRGRLSPGPRVNSGHERLNLCHDACVTLDNVLWMLTALGAVVVLLTRMRLSAVDQQAGSPQIPMSVARCPHGGGSHGDRRVGVLPELAHRPARARRPVRMVGRGPHRRAHPRALGSGAGRHAAPATDDSWAQGPSLSILGHVGMVLGVAFFTFCVVTGRIV